MIALSRPLTAFDLETTTANPATARIVQIAIIQIHPDGRRVEYQSLVNPEVPIPADATAIHGITDADVKDARPWAQLAPRLIHAFTNCDYLGYNIARFDLEVLRAEFRRVGVDTTVPDGQAPPRIVDPYVVWVKQEPRTLSDAVKKFLGRELAGAHDATADVKATVEIAEHLFTYWPDLPTDLDALHALQFPPVPGQIDRNGKFVWQDGEAVVNFGKHKGTPLRNIDKGFLRWMTQQDFPDDARAIAYDALGGRYPTQEAA